MELDEKLIIKDKIHISYIVECIILFLFTIALFIEYFNKNEEKSVAILFLGILFGIIVISCIICLTFKRSYFKVDSMGIHFRDIEYKKKVFIDWSKIDAIIIIDKVLTINKNNKQIQEHELNAKSISNLDQFKELTQEENEGEAEWLENGIYIVTKKVNNINSEIYSISFKIDDNYEEIIKRIWINNI